MWNLCSGKTCAKPSASSIDAVTASVSWRFGRRDRRRRGCWLPSPSFLAVSCAIASASPVTILTLTPRSRAVAMRRLGVFAGRVKQRQHADQPPRAVAVGAGDAQGTKAALRELVDRLSTLPFTSPAFADSSRITCGAPLVTLNAVPSGALTVASVRLPTGSNGSKCATSYDVQDRVILDAAEDCQVDRVVVVGA